MQNEFGSATENTALKEAVVERIQREGGIAFRDFMAMALYEPGMGYYCSPGEKMGRSGDYLTSPEVSPVFGVLVGRQLRDMWLLLGKPTRFDIVEAGAGNGTLCRDILGWAQRTACDMLEATRYTIVELIAALRSRQQQGIEADDLSQYVEWTDSLPDAIQGCLVTNELLDSMPVHRVVLQGGQLREIFVDWDGANFVEQLRPPSTPELERYFARLGVLPGDECRAEVNLEAPRWMRVAGSALNRGFVLTFDYGYDADELYAPWRKDGTLLCFYRHNPSGDPYSRIGRQDMTSHVDFTSLRQAGEDAGLTTIGTVTQAEFLLNLGVADALAPSAAEIDLEERLSRRRAVSELIDPAGLGRIKVMAQGKGVGDVRLRGFAGDA